MLREDLPIIHVGNPPADLRGRHRAAAFLGDTQDQAVAAREQCQITCDQILLEITGDGGSQSYGDCGLVTGL